MKKSVFIFALMLLTLASCSKLESNEKKYAEGLQSEDYEESAKAMAEFAQWLMTDRATMTHDFKLMREQLGMKICTSADGQLRCYSWPTEGKGTAATSYANVLQWYMGDSFIGFCGPIDQMLAGRKADIKKMRTLGHSIDTIFDVKIQDKTVYLIAQSYIDEGNLRRAYVSGSFINGRLALMPFLFDGIEIAGNNAFHEKAGSLTPVGKLFKWDEKSKTFYAYQTDDNDNIIPGKYTEYRLQGDQFKRVEPVVSEENN